MRVQNLYTITHQGEGNLQRPTVGQTKQGGSRTILLSGSRGNIERVKPHRLGRRDRHPFVENHVWIVFILELLEPWVVRAKHLGCSVR